MNDKTIVHIKWSGKPDEDYIDLSRQYMNAGYLTIKEVIEESHNSNIKYDMWFLPGVYMLRQEIELLVKAGIAAKGATKKELETIFLEVKHNVKASYEIYKDRYGVEYLNEAECEWLGYK